MLFLLIVIFSFFSQIGIACNANILWKQTGIDQKGAAYIVAEMEVTRKFEELVLVLDPLNWSLYKPEYFKHSSMQKIFSGSAIPGQDYDGILYEEFNQPGLFASSLFRNFLNVSALRTSTGRKIKYSLNRSLSTYIRFGLFPHFQLGGITIDEGYVELIRGPDGTHKVRFSKHLKFDMRNLIAPLWTSGSQNATLRLGMGLLAEQTREVACMPLKGSREILLSLCSR